MHFSSHDLTIRWRRFFRFLFRIRSRSKRDSVSELTSLKFSVSVLLTVFLFFGNSAQYVPFLKGIPELLMAKMLFILAAPVLFWSGWEFSPLLAIRNTEEEKNTGWFVGLAAWMLFGYSVFATFFPNFIAAIGGAVETHYHTMGFVITAALFSRRMQNDFLRKHGRSEVAFLAHTGTKARLLRNGEETIVASSELSVGDSVAIGDNEIIPCDGVIMGGSVRVDESFFTGDMESTDKSAGDDVCAGMRAEAGKGVVRVAHRPRERLGVFLFGMIRKAAALRAPFQERIESLVRYSAPAAAGMAFASIVIWMIAREGSLSVRGALFSAVTLFLILEPGEFTDAVYSLMRRGIWSAAERGIFVRHPRLFEMADRSKKLAVPLFGILTKGAPRVEGMQSFTPHHRSKDVLSLAASVVGTYIHPIAEAIRRAAEEERIPPLFVGSASLMWKGGAEGRVKIAGMTRTVFVGSRRACSESGIGMRPAVAEIVGREEEEGKIILLVAVDREIVGMVALRDDIIPGAEEAIRTIEELGNEVCLLTGVSEVPVRVLARSVGIRNTLSDLTPQEKERAMRDFQTEGLTVLAAGAGWKDEPVLRAASASIVSSRAREFLQESGADCLLFGGGIEGAARVMDFSRALMKRIRQATWLVFLFILLAALIAAGALIPFGGFAPNPIAIAAAKVAISMVIYRASL